MEITFAQLARFKPSAKTARGALVLLLPETRLMPDWLERVDRDCYGLIKKAIASSRFEYKKKQVLTIIAPHNMQYEQLILIGLGRGKELTAHGWEQVGGTMIGELNRLGVKQAGVMVHNVRGCKISEPMSAVHIAIGARLKSYRFDKYRTTLKPHELPSLERITIAVNDTREAQSIFDQQQHVLNAVDFTRDLVTEPANILHPESFAERLLELKSQGLDVEVLGEAELAKLGCGALLGVGQGSIRESKMVILRYNGGKKNEAPLAFVGKGVCFDTGGISIKPAAGMEDMKWDMGGAGVVSGLLLSLATRKAKVNAVGVVGLVENMPDGNAQRPGDVVTSMSGQTIEVLNTDAEGRLVLADCLWYTQDRFKPRFMLDLATLTGAILVTLGTSRAGLFTDDDDLAEKLLTVGGEVGEPVWRLPLGEEYDAMINSDIADMKNLGEGRYAGSTTAAQFLKRFVKDTPWVHLDIAGTVWSPQGAGHLAQGRDRLWRAFARCAGG